MLRTVVNRRYKSKVVLFQTYISKCHIYTEIFPPIMLHSVWSWPPGPPVSEAQQTICTSLELCLDLVVV